MSAQMSPRAITWEAWALSEEADRRFRKVLAAVGIPFLILAVVFTVIKLTEPVKEKEGYSNPVSIELQAQAQEVAPQPEQPKKAAENQPQKPQQAPKVQQPKPQPVPVPQPTAREKAQKEMQVFNQLQDLRQQDINTNTPLISSTITSKGSAGGSAASAEAIAQSAAANSGGGFGGTGAYTSTQSGPGLGSRSTGAVKSNIGFGHDPSKAGANGKVADARTLGEIQEVFDRNKGPLTGLYNRAARENAGMGDGKIVIRITIEPDGAVSACSVVSSSFNDPDFEAKVIQRIKLFRFAAKSVPPFTYGTYPIEFHPM